MRPRHTGLSLSVFFSALILTLTASHPTHATGGSFGMEFAIDAPWRLEPFTGGDGQMRYGAIPIVLEFADANFEVDRGWLQSREVSRIYIGKLKSVRIREYDESQPDVVAEETIVPVSQIQEIERKVPMSRPDNEPSHELCRPAYGQDCTNVLDITSAHEWHAALWYRPKLPVTPGRNILLQVTAITERGSITREWINYLAVHAGEAPLPRFAEDWLYGDLHYHSQMTDNEGETGYSYRNVARALAATGVDFVFATDHASGGRQVLSNGEARDLNPTRFATAKSIIYGPDGANEAIAREMIVGSFARATNGKTLPQVYMGEELDAWPEISAEEFARGLIDFGDHRTYPFSKMGFCLVGPLPDEACHKIYARPAGTGSYLIYDLQGLPYLEEPRPSRQHMVYLPTTSSLGREGFISSATGEFGGASKRLSALLSEVERGGYAFLAHPLENSKPGGSQGPDIVPYSHLELTQAWASQAILGLEFWNENIRVQSEADVDSVMDVSAYPPLFPTSVMYDFRWPFHKHRVNAPRWSWEQFNLWRDVAGRLYQGAVTWDRYLRKGLDPEQTASIPWLERGTPRKWFMAGGSDAHGDFNFRREGRPACGGFSNIGARWCDLKQTDTAIANPRNLVSMRPRAAGGVSPSTTAETLPSRDGLKRYANTHVIDALRTGNFSVSDGPIVRILVDANRNGIVEDTDFPMGSVVDFYPGEYIPLLVEWISTPEFGPIDQVDVYIGNTRVTFAPEEHGPIIESPPFFGNPKFGPYAGDPSGALQVKLADDKDRFNRTDVDAKIRYHGVARIFVGPGQFQLAETDGALFYARAFAKTISAYPTDWFNDRVCKYSGDAGNKCGDRFAYTNPVWGRYHKACPKKDSRPRPVASSPQSKPISFLDSDNNAYPDICEHVVLDACSPHPETGFDPNEIDGRAEGAMAEKGGGTSGGPGASAATAASAEASTDNAGRAPTGTPEKPALTKSCQRLIAL